MAGLAVQQVAQFQNLGGLVYALLDFRFRHLGELQAIGHVLVVGHVRVQRVVLEHHGDVALGGLQVIDLFVGNDQVTIGDFFQACNHAQQGGLAAARGAYQHDEFAVLDFDVDAVNHGHSRLAGAVTLDDVL